MSTGPHLPDPAAPLGYFRLKDVTYAGNVVLSNGATLSMAVDPEGSWFFGALAGDRKQCIAFSAEASEVIFAAMAGHRDPAKPLHPLRLPPITAPESPA